MRFGLVLIPALAVLLTLAGPACGQDEPPVEGRPPDFSGFIGAYRIQAAARPTVVPAGDPILLTLTIQGKGRVPPRRPLILSGMDRLKKEFQVDDLPEQDRHPDAETWQFVYRLRPRSTRVQRIPRLGLHYFNPAVGYQVSFTDAIPLTVRPREQPSQLKDTGPADRQPRYALITGPAVLEREAASPFPGPWFLALLLLLPPAVCLTWLWLWRHWFPDAARLAQRRRSRAARVALKALRRVGRVRAPAERAERVAAILGQYLQQRLGGPAAEPTPLEAGQRLERAGAAPALASKCAALLRTCDAARFAPQPPAGPADLGEQATLLIRQLEAEPCLSRIL